MLQVVLCAIAMLVVLGVGCALDMSLDGICTVAAVGHCCLLFDSVLDGLRFLAPPKSSTRPSYLCLAALLGSYALLLPGASDHLANSVCSRVDLARTGYYTVPVHSWR